jgi:hypothetical protein
MEELRLGDQMVRYDRNATAAAYALMPSGGADRCGRVHCRNFAAQRDSIYNNEFRDLLNQLGVDSNKEGEVYDKVGPFDVGIRPTGGWFYFVGQLVEPVEKMMQTGHLQYWFQPSFPRPPACFGERVAAIEFSLEAPWVLDESPY